ncbi:MAG TPA: class I SAM-dependent methyltransferase [Burkholderiaceae bacterium]|nr:class I SAM-dependent methyltransferase [Burkholderiaceae bacterium]
MSESQSIVNFSDFLASAPGRYLLEWEQRVLDSAVADIFGYHAMQLGMPQIDALRENRMPLRCIALDGSSGRPVWTEQHIDGRREATVVARFDELPFAAASIDLLVLPHVLEFAQEPHRVLREVDRVLVPEGHLVLTGFNPASLWGAHHWMRRIGLRPFLPHSSQLIALPRLKDWLKLLSFEVNRGRFGCYVPWVRTESWITRLSFLEKAGDRWWPVLGGIYALTAVKRVHGMRLVGLVKKWREERRAALAPATPVAQLAYRTDEAVTVRVGVTAEAANDRAIKAAQG